MSELPQRKPIRLKGYDYSQNGYYFITICTKDRKCLFGNIIDGKMVLNEFGKISDDEINNIVDHYNNIKIDNYVIMPNHVHIILIITNPTERINPFPTTVDVANVIGKFKAGVTRIVGNALMHSEKQDIWQKSYHDRIIRNEKEYHQISEYIDNNPLQWELDCHNENNSKYKDWSKPNDK